MYRFIDVSLEDFVNESSEIREDLDKSSKVLEEQSLLLKNSNKELNNLNYIIKNLSPINHNRDLTNLEKTVITTSVENFRQHFNITNKHMKDSRSFEHYNNYPTLKNSLESIQELKDKGSNKFITLLKNMFSGVKDYFHKLINAYDFYEKKFSKIKSLLSKEELSSNKGKFIVDKKIFSNLNINRNVDLNEIKKSLNFEENFNSASYKEIIDPTIEFLTEIENEKDVVSFINKSFKKDKFHDFLKKCNFKLLVESNFQNNAISIWRSDYYLPGNKKLVFFVKDKASNNLKDNKKPLYYHMYPVDFKIEEEPISIIDFNLPAISDKNLDIVFDIVENILSSKKSLENQKSQIIDLGNHLENLFNKTSQSVRDTNFDYDRDDIDEDTDLNYFLELVNENASYVAYFIIEMLKATSTFKINLLEYLMVYLEKSIKLVD